MIKSYAILHCLFLHISWTHLIKYWKLQHSAVSTLGHDLEGPPTPEGGEGKSFPMLT